jgi:hypothetical protein
MVRLICVGVCGRGGVGWGGMRRISGKLFLGCVSCVSTRDLLFESFVALFYVDIGYNYDLLIESIAVL